MYLCFIMEELDIFKNKVCSLLILMGADSSILSVVSSYKHTLSHDNTIESLDDIIEYKLKISKAIHQKVEEHYNKFP